MEKICRYCKYYEFGKCTNENNQSKNNSVELDVYNIFESGMLDQAIRENIDIDYTVDFLDGELREQNIIKKNKKLDRNFSDGLENFIIEAISESIRDYVYNSVWDSIYDSVDDSVWDSVWNSVYDSILASIGNYFPNIEKWKYIEYQNGKYPFKSVIKLHELGFVPSFDGTHWRLHSGENMNEVYKISREELSDM